MREAVHDKTGHRVAFKVYDKYKLNTNQTNKKCVQREVTILGKLTNTVNEEDGAKVDSEILGHQGVMKLYDVIDTQRQLYLVVELCSGKMLQTAVKESTSIGQVRKNLPENVCASIIYQVMRAMEYYHSFNISHRDIKLDNILVDLKSKDFKTKIIDFGFATRVSNPATKQSAFCGTPAYMSP